jgi:hypothetical protein
MSRYERRLGAKSSSPRPGQAVCKIPKKKNNILSGFINIREKNANFSNTSQNTSQNKVIIEEIEEVEDSNIRKIMNINDQLKLAMEKITDKNIRLIYGHEIRLNTIELNVDCLNEIRCEKIYYSQQEEEKEQETINNLEKMEEININYNNLLLKINSNEKQFNEKNEESNKNNVEEMRKIMDIETNERRLECLINDLTEKLDTIPNSIEEKIKSNEKSSENVEKEKEREKEREQMIINIENLKIKNEMLLNIVKKIASKLDDSKDIIKEIKKIKK